MEEITKLIDDLQPQAARYDTPIADDLLLCTFPNGIKTWIFTYATSGAQRRRSIGVYPEMSLADARQTLFAARKLQRVEDHLIEHGLAGEIVRDATPDEATGSMPSVQAARRWLEGRMIGSAIAGGLMSMAILLGVRQLPYEFFFPTASLAATARNDAERIATEPAAPAPDVASPTPVSATANTETPAPLAVETGEATPSAAPQPVALSPANQALLKAQNSLRGSVTREVLARGVEQDRPVNRFDTQLSLEGDEATTLFYFTELRGMAGKTVLHRWLHEGELVSEVPLQIGAGWLFTLHSSATIAPNMTGRWEVRVCDASGKALEQETFELTSTAQLSSR